MKPVNTIDGYSKKVYIYSDNYNSCICKYYDIGGNLVKEEKDK